MDKATQPDLGYAVSFLSRYLHKPSVKHLTQVKNVLRYLSKEAQEYANIIQEILLDWDLEIRRLL